MFFLDKKPYLVERVKFRAILIRYSHIGRNAYTFTASGSLICGDIEGHNMSLKFNFMKNAFSLSIFEQETSN